MQSVSQNVVIDTVKKTTQLNKEGTIKIGNALKQGEAYQYLYSDCNILLDSLFKQSNLHKENTRFLKDSVIQPLKMLSSENQAEAKLHKEKYNLQEQYYKAELKRQKSKKWTWLGVGAGVGVVLALLLGS